MTDKLIEWEMHHITPRHAGGTDDPSNLIRVNKKMHRFLHLQRYKELGSVKDLYAYNMMSGDCDKSAAGKIGGKVSARLRFEKYGDYFGGKSHVLTREDCVKGGLNHNYSDKCKEWNATGKARARDYIVKHPDGTVEEVTNLTQFAKKHGLNRTTLKGLATGQINRNREGWEVSYAI